MALLEASHATTTPAIPSLIPPLMTAPTAADLEPEPALCTPLRCRLGRHHWVPLAMSLAGARAQLAVSFCRDCPAMRRQPGRAVGSRQ